MVVGMRPDGARHALTNGRRFPGAGAAGTPLRAATTMTSGLDIRFALFNTLILSYYLDRVALMLRSRRGQGSTKGAGF